MSNFKFKETIDFFSNQLNTQAYAEDIEDEEVELVLDDGTIVVFKAGTEVDSFHMQLDLAVFLAPSPDEHLACLAAANFLGVETGGCSLCLDESGTLLSLKASTTAGTTAQENWDRFHLMIAAAQHWAKLLDEWQECVSLVKVSQEEPQKNNANIFFKA